MKRIPRVKGNSYTDYSKQNMLYCQMSHHYRRLYNAKSRIDTSPPYSMRIRENHSGHAMVGPQPTATELAFVDLIVNDTKQSPAAFSLCNKDNAWPGERMLCKEESLSVTNQEQRCCVHMKPFSCQICSTKRTVATRNTRVTPDIMDQHSSNFVTPDGAFKPRILKTNAQSRVRELTVYHPPRRRPQRSKEAPTESSALEKDFEEKQQVEDGFSSSSSGPWQQVTLYTEIPVPKANNQVLEPSVQPWTEITDCKCAMPKLCSKISSRDSAYNGGVSSSGESRGPTPEQSPVQTRPETVVQSRRETRHNKRKQDSLYINFIHEITQDILSCGIYSNKGLQQVFQRHINQNIGILNKDRMKSEIRKLKIQLDIPEDHDVGSECFNSLAKQEQLGEHPTYYSCAKTNTRKQNHIPISTDGDFTITMQPQDFSGTSLELGSLTYIELQQICQERSGKSKVIENNFTMTEDEVVTTLEEMGFESTAAKEICQSLSDKDLQSTPNLYTDDMSTKAVPELKNGDRKLRDKIVTEKVASIEQRPVRSNPISNIEEDSSQLESNKITELKSSYWNVAPFKRRQEERKDKISVKENVPFLSKSDKISELKNGNWKLQKNVMDKVIEKDATVNQDQVKCEEYVSVEENGPFLTELDQLPPASDVIGVFLTSLVDQIDDLQTKNLNASTVQTDLIGMIEKELETNLPMNAIVGKTGEKYECDGMMDQQALLESTSQKSDSVTIFVTLESKNEIGSNMQNAIEIDDPLGKTEIKIEGNNSFQVTGILFSSSGTDLSKKGETTSSINEESISECLSENDSQAGSVKEGSFSEIDEELVNSSSEIDEELVNSSSTSDISTLAEHLKNFDINPVSLATSVLRDVVDRTPRVSQGRKKTLDKEKKPS